MSSRCEIAPRCDLCKRFVKFKRLFFGYCANQRKEICKPSPCITVCDGFEAREMWWSIDEG